MGIPAVSAGEGTAEIVAFGEGDFPVTRVTLYTAGLANMVHETTVTDNQTILFPVEHKDLNDILKSLVVEDLGGGTVEAVTFASGDPLSAALGDMRVNPSGSPALRDFLLRTQGEEVSVTTPDGSFAGRIFSVEEKGETDGNHLYLNLMDSQGIRKVEITQLSGLTYTDSVLKEELNKALSLIAQSRVKSTRLLKISFKGSGRRKIRLSYIRAVPLWKTSYRINLDRMGVPRLEGWALVQNTGSIPWEDVKLGFVAGSPNAFTMDLATPRYIHREQVDIATSAPIGATSYDRGYEPEPSMMAEKSSRTAAPMAMAMEEAYGLSDYDEWEESYIPEPSVAPRATGVRSGNFYRYDVRTPVTVESRSSAMIPILTQEEAGTSLGVYDPSYNLVFKGVRLTNDSDAHWAAGPATILEGRYYGGDALLPEMIPGTSRLLTYAVHGAVEVQKTSSSEPQRIVSLQIHDGILYRTDKILRETLYRIAGDEKELLLIHPKESGWTLTEHPDIQEETTGEYRFTLKEWKEPVPVREENIRSQQYGLANMRIQDYSYYIEWEGISLTMKDAFQRLSRMKEDTDRIRNEISQANSRINRIERDQNRVRENMKVLEKDSDLYEQYADQLSRQEKEIQDTYKQLADLQNDLQKAEQKLKDAIVSLNM